MPEDGADPYQIALTHFIVAEDVERSVRFYTDVLGGSLIRSGEPSYVAFGDSAKERVGDWVVAVGNPYGLGGTVNYTKGNAAISPGSAATFADASNFKGVKGYEAYAAREATATAVLASSVTGDEKAKPKTPGYHASNLLIGTPEEIFNRLKAAQEACSFEELTIVPQFGTMPYEEAMASTELFAKEVLPAAHKMEAPLHPAALPENALA